MTYLEAIEDALERFPDMPVEMRQAFYTVLLVGDVTDDETDVAHDLYAKHNALYQAASLLLPTHTPFSEYESLYTQWVNTYISLIANE